MQLNFDIAYTYDYLTIAVPFLIALALFHGVYWGCYKSFTARIRAKNLVAR